MKLNIWWNLLVLFYICWNLKILETHDCDKDTSLETWWVIHGAMCSTLGILFCSLGIPPTPIAAPLADLTLILQPKYSPQKMLHHQFQRGKDKASVFFLPLHKAMTIVSVSSLCHDTKLGSWNELPTVHYCSSLNANHNSKYLYCLLCSWQCSKYFSTFPI